VCALLAGYAASLAALGLALLVVPLMAVAAKLTREQARKSARRREERPRGQVVMDERIKARVEATIWPE
jgi:hypothetical protein